MMLRDLMICLLMLNHRSWDAHYPFQVSSDSVVCALLLVIHGYGQLRAAGCSLEHGKAFG